MDPNPLQLTIDLCYTITHPIPMVWTPFIDHIEEFTHIHIPMADGGRWDLCYTITLNRFHIEKNAHIPMADPIKHRSMQHHYTQYVSDIEVSPYPMVKNAHIPNEFHR